MRIVFSADLCYPYPTLDLLGGPVTEVTAEIPRGGRVWEAEQRHAILGGGYRFSPYGSDIDADWNAVLLGESTVIEVPSVEAGLSPPVFLIHRLSFPHNPRYLALIEVYSLRLPFDESQAFSDDIKASLENGEGRTLSFYVPRSF